VVLWLFQRERSVKLESDPAGRGINSVFLGLFPVLIVTNRGNLIESVPTAVTIKASL